MSVCVYMAISARCAPRRTAVCMSHASRVLSTRHDVSRGYTEHATTIMVHAPGTAAHTSPPDHRHPHTTRHLSALIVTDVVTRSQAFRHFRRRGAQCKGQAPLCGVPHRHRQRPAPSAQGRRGRNAGGAGPWSRPGPSALPPPRTAFPLPSLPQLLPAASSLPLTALLVV